MKIVFWLDPQLGFDRNTPEILANIADGLVEFGYQVEILVVDQFLDSYPAKLATKKVYFAEDEQQVVADILISNCLEKLLRTDLHRVSERIWLALEEDLQQSIHKFETYHLFDVVRVITLLTKVQKRLLTAGIEAFLLQPSLKLDDFKTNLPLEKDNWGITLSLFESQPEVFYQVLQGVEMTLNALNSIKVYLLTDQQYQFKSALSIETKVKPSFVERLKIYQRSDIVLHIPGQESFSLIPLESMASGIPVVVSQHKAIDQYAKNMHNSLILDQITPPEIALSILNIIKIGKIRKQLKSYGLKTVKNYNAQKIMQDFKNFLEQTISLERPVPEHMDQETDKLVDIVILNDNSGQQIKRCLESLYRHLKNSFSAYRLIVIDNSSSDESLTYLKQQAGIDLIANQSNLGFAKACNQGILGSKSEYIVFLHSTVEVKAGWLKPLLTEIKKSDVGVVIPQINHAATEAEQSLESLPRLLGLPNVRAQVLQSGCQMIKREILQRVGLYDQVFNHSLASIDYLLRIQEKGYKISYVPDSLIIDHADFQEQDLLNDQQKDCQQYFRSKWGLALEDALITEPLPQRKVDGVVIFGLNLWQKKSQRTEIVIDYLARQGSKIVYVEPYCAPTSPMEFGNGRYLYNFLGSGTIEYNLLNSGRRVEMMADLQRYLSDWKITTPLVWVEAPWWESILKHLEHLGIVYTTPELLLGEDMEIFQRLKEKYFAEEQQLLKNADLIIIGSRQREEDLADYAGKVCYSPGGFFPTDLERFFAGHFTMPEELANLVGLKVGIVGSINQFFPRQLLRQLAFNHQDVSFVFIGDITSDLGDLREMSNLHFVGNKAWEDLLDCVYFFDLLLYPYQDNNLNSYIDPYRVNYYLKMGKPVIAFDHRQLERFGDSIFQAIDEEEFLEIVTETLQCLESEKSLKEVNSRASQIRGESWEQVFKKIFEQVVDKIAFVQKPVVMETPQKQEPVKKNFFVNFLKQLVEKYQRLFKTRQ